MNEFLTRSDVSAPAKTDGVLSALRRAASETGADFSYLLNTAMRESSLNPAAKAASSSATGLFQFIEQTWLGTLREHGAEHGLKSYADAIEVGSNGRFKVTDTSMRQEILALRKDPETAALMAGEMTNEMRGDMESALGRSVSSGELYVAHFLGPKAATKMIKAAEATPQATAAQLFPLAAAANRSIFFDKNGEARSVSSVVLAEAAQPVRTTPWRGDVADNSLPPMPSFTPAAAAFNATYSHDQTMVMAPIMVQLLASLDPLPQMAAIFNDDKPQLRRSSDDLI